MRNLTICFFFLGLLLSNLAFGNQVISGILDETLTLSCSSPETNIHFCSFINPKGIIFCDDNSEEDCSSEPNISLQMSEKSCFLVIDELNSENYYGAWKCTLKSWFGETIKTETLQIIQPIDASVEILNYWGTVSVEMGVTTKFTCSIKPEGRDFFETLPGSLTWEFGDEVLINNNSYSKGLDNDWIQSIEITPYKADDKKKLSCSLTSELKDGITLSLFHFNYSENSIRVSKKENQLEILVPLETLPRISKENVNWEFSNSELKNQSPVYISLEDGDQNMDNYIVKVLIDNYNSSKNYDGTLIFSNDVNLLNQIPIIISPRNDELYKVVEQTPQNENPSISSPSTLMSISIILLILFLVCLLCLCFYCCRYRSKNKKGHYLQSSESVPDPESYKSFLTMDKKKLSESQDEVFRTVHEISIQESVLSMTSSPYDTSKPLYITDIRNGGKDEIVSIIEKAPMISTTATQTPTIIRANFSSFKT